MQRLTTSKFWIIIMFVMFSCIGDFDIKLPFDEPKLVVDALINSSGESELYLSWTYPPGEKCFDKWGTPIGCLDDPGTGPYEITGTATIETGSGTVYAYDVEMRNKKSFAQISLADIPGVPGETYSLTIELEYNGTTTRYTSETRMRDTPVIQVVDYELREGDIGKEDNYVPLISFHEPQGEKNYYLFRLCEMQGPTTRYCGSSRVWSVSMISDEFIPENVSRLSVDDGATIATLEFYPYNDAIVNMYSVDKNTYEFYKSLIEQFSNDGGTYSPSPALFKGNISGGAIGIFRAVDESSDSLPR